MGSSTLSRDLNTAPSLPDKVWDLLNGRGVGVASNIHGFIHSKAVSLHLGGREKITGYFELPHFTT